MRFYASTIIAAALAVGSATAQDCLNDNAAGTLATNFGLLISNYSNELADKTIYPDFVDYSESVNTLINSGGNAPMPLLNPTFSSREEFKVASAMQPPVPFEVQNIWYNCDTVTVRWLSAQTPLPVVGISVLHTTCSENPDSPVPYQIDQIWAEFDSGAWLVNLGVLKPAAANLVDRSP
ncbi:hypothetical protein KC367_g8070 [Hortaea werneckii]|nr:hypothetical protein KC342_g9737 [Hortaea werneckii]KAI7094597.1 hypothetical protein KC339_g11501 [Hortaea werneckii]KAI7310883.1 hypothetical protein KC340_g10346 [Hortaea werneckii]KAI7313276.1 hypothetical protein KC315_g11735 [Hortaea werneckii]KAI7391669.1 hypothetical protein KC328_g7389 [Hortaea werneckii]